MLWKLLRARWAMRQALTPSGGDEFHPYVGLSASSIQLARLKFGSAVPAVNLVLDQLVHDQIFAGVKTAIDVAANIARLKGLPLRLIVLGRMSCGARAREMKTFLIREFDLADNNVEVLNVREADEVFDEQDIWVATFWSTAHALDVAARLGRIDPRRVVYLVQDYEPGFLAWSSDYAAAQSTYHAGFQLLVNSSPVRKYLSEHESVDVPDECVFAPQLDFGRLEQAAALRRRSDCLRVFFYGRPDRPRNLFPLGVSTLRVLAREADARRIGVRVYSAGGSHGPIQLGLDREVVNLGTLQWQDYFSLIADVDVALTLQFSPHPSHPPLDAAVSGAWAVTNDIEGTRGALHSQLLAGRPDPDALAGLILQGWEMGQDLVESKYDPTFLTSLGGRLPDAVAAATRKIA